MAENHWIFLALHPVLLTLLHGAFRRATGSAGQSLALKAILAGLATQAFLIIFFPPPSGALGFIYYALCCVLLSHLYFHVFNMSETARRIRILVELLTGQNSKAYSAEHQVSVRIKRLMDLDQVKRVGDIYFIRRGTLWAIARAMAAIEQFLFPARPSNRA